jgi:act minimal PKS acyl carrier protein
MMRESVGVDEGVELDGAIADVEFTELGYDSLAVLELASQIRRRYGVPVPDEAALELTTPGKLLTFVNDLLTGAVR